MDAQTKELAQNQGLAPDCYPQVHGIETSGSEGPKRSFRNFCIDSCRKDIDFNRLVYQCIDSDMHTNQVTKYDACKDYAWFVRHKDTGDVRVQASACRLRWCPLCMKTKKMIITQEVQKWLHDIKKPKFVTFTLKHNDDPLRDRVKDLYKYFRAVRRTKWFKKNVRGGVWFFQITINKESGQWHPHIHCLVDSNFLQHAELSELWELITGESKVVDIRAVKDSKKTANYVARYAAAPCRLSTFSIDEAIEIVQTMHGKRICGTWGTGKTMSFKITKPEDWEKWEKLGLFTLTYSKTYNPHWCDMVIAAWEDKVALPYRPPPGMSGPLPWDDEKSGLPESFEQAQMQLF